MCIVHTAHCLYVNVCVGVACSLFDHIIKLITFYLLGYRCFIDACMFVDFRIDGLFFSIDILFIVVIWHVNWFVLRSLCVALFVQLCWNFFFLHSQIALSQMILNIHISQYTELWSHPNAHACFSFRSMPVHFASNYSRSARKSVTFNFSLVLYGIELLRSYNNMKICLHKNCAHIQCKISTRNSKNERCAFVHYQHDELINEHVQKAIRFSKWKTIQYFNPWRKFYLYSFSCLFLHWVD